MIVREKVNERMSVSGYERVWALMMLRTVPIRMSSERVRGGVRGWVLVCDSV